MDDTSYFDQMCDISDWNDSEESEAFEPEPTPNVAINTNAAAPMTPGEPLYMEFDDQGFVGYGDAPAYDPPSPQFTNDLATVPSTPAQAKALAEEQETRAILSELPRSVQDWAMEAIKAPYNSARLRALDDDINLRLGLSPEQCNMVRQFVRAFGRRERKPPRDDLLRDRNTRGVVLELRKKTAFLGYAWRRMRPPPLQPVGLGGWHNENAANRRAGGRAVFGGGDGAFESAWGEPREDFYKASRWDVGAVRGLHRGRLNR